jgi:hypothetical protein
MKETCEMLTKLWSDILKVRYHFRDLKSMKEKEDIYLAYGVVQDWARVITSINFWIL